MTKVSAIVILAVTLGFSLSASARTWTQAATGRTLEAEIVSVTGNTVILKLKNGRTANVPIASLSQDDQDFISNRSSGSTPQPSKAESMTDSWPAFRGPDGTDISPDTGLLKQWPPDGPKQLWVFDQAGMGYSGFSIANGKLYTMGTKRKDIHMICVNIADGSETWSKSIADDKRDYNVDWGHGPRGTPSYSDGKLYGLSPSGDLVCVDAEKGSKLWDADLVKDFDGTPSGWGYCESPLIDGEMVIVAPGGNRSGMVALNKNDGKVIWKAEGVRPGKAEYSTTVATTMNGKRQYVRFFEKAVYSVDAATGNLLWKGEFPKGNLAVVPTAIIEGNQVYLSAGYSAGCLAIQIGPENSVTQLWTNNVMTNHHGGVIKLDDYLYGFDDGRGLVCQDWKSGRQIWANKDRQFLAKGAVHIADGMIYTVNEQNGAITLVEASPKGYTQKGRFILEPQSRDRHPQGRVWTHPVVIGGRLFLRDQEYIHCYEVKSK